MSNATADELRAHSILVQKTSGGQSQRQDCDFADTPSPSLLKHLLKSR